MPRMQTWLVIGAAFLVAGALWPWSARLRFACAAGAIAIVVMLAIVRLRAHAGLDRREPADDELTTRVERIRAERAARMGPRR